MNILLSLLNFLARTTIAVHKPRIIGITGSVGKTSTKEAVLCIFKKKFRVRASRSSYNNELGLPLTILGYQTPGRNVFKWLQVIFGSLIGLLQSYPQVLILEMGADRVGDIKKLLQITAKIEGAIITDIGISHLQNYPSHQSLVTEKLSILSGLQPGGVAVVNQDNEFIKTNHYKGLILRYGLTDQADIRATDVQLLRRGQEVGINFKIHYKGTVVPFYIPDSLGLPTVYSVLAAAGMAIPFGVNLVDSSQALQHYHAPPGRLYYLPGIKKSWIIDDTYNAAPASTIAALSVLQQVALGRKVAVIGDMAELGAENDAGHRQVAAKIQEVGVQVIILVGLQSKIIQEELLARKFDGKILWFETADQARMPVQNIIAQGDAVLIKGSQSMRLERVVKEIMADPMIAENVLVRQSAIWLKTP